MKSEIFSRKSQNLFLMALLRCFQRCVKYALKFMVLVGSSVNNTSVG